MQPNYNASGTLKADIAMFGTRLLPPGQDQGARTTRTETFDGTLTVKGIVLGSVTTVATHHILELFLKRPFNWAVGLLTQRGRSSIRQGSRKAVADTGRWW
jgi:hypothetical protein